MRRIAIIAALALAGACSSTPAGSKQNGAVSFASCAEAKAAGYETIKKGEPGYSAKLDGDKDGVACDSPRPEAVEPVTLTLEDSTPEACEAYAAKQSRLNPGDPAWTWKMEGTTCKVTQG